MLENQFLSYYSKKEGIDVMFDAVLFDMDGLMLDTEPITIKAKVEEGNKIGLAITEEMVKETIGMSQFFVDKYFKSLFGEKYNHEYFKKKRLEYLFKYMEENGLPLKSGLIELLDFLTFNNIKIAIVTSSTKEVINQYKKYGNVFDYFSLIVTGDEVKEGKPSPDVYLYASSKIGVDPSKCLVLEDSKNGIISASKANMIVCMIPDLIIPDEEVLSYKPFILKSLFDVIPFVKKSNSIK